MKRITYRTIGLTLAATSLFIVGCGERQADDGQVDTLAQTTSGGTVASGATAAATETADMRIEVDLDARRLYVIRDGQRVATHSVAVGSERWPTQRGNWTIRQVVFNPDWVPPDESWAEEREPRESGDPQNPLGRAQLVYDAPRSIHGTNNPSSIGQAVSHGSIRLPNDVIVRLAREAMEAGGAPRDEAWFRRAEQNRRQKQVVDLPRPVPIRVY